MNTATVIVHGAESSIRLAQLESIVRIRIAENRELGLDASNVVVHFATSPIECKSVSCLVLLRTDRAVDPEIKEKVCSKVALCLEHFLKPKPRFIQVLMQRVEAEDYYFSF